MTSKYDNMVMKNREINQEKECKAITEIRQMLEADELVSPSVLAKRTSLSRAFFYNNERVKAELERARSLQNQKDFVAAKSVIFDKAMQTQIDVLKKQVTKLTRENTDLKVECKRLRTALKTQDWEKFKLL